MLDDLTVDDLAAIRFAGAQPAAIQGDGAKIFGRRNGLVHASEEHAE